MKNIRSVFVSFSGVFIELFGKQKKYIKVPLLKLNIMP